MIEITFKGENIRELYLAMKKFMLDVMEDYPETPKEAIPPLAGPDPASPAPPKQLSKAAIDAKERMAKARAAKVAKNKASKPKKPEPEPEAAQVQGLEGYPVFEDLRIGQFEPEPLPEPEPEPIDPVNLAALRLKTTEDLQAAYSGGKHKQVMALLSKFGNGAKSFRELQIEDFVPIRKAIDDGALA